LLLANLLIFCWSSREMWTSLSGSPPVFIILSETKHSGLDLSETKHSGLHLSQTKHSGIQNKYNTDRFKEVYSSKKHFGTVNIKEFCIHFVVLVENLAYINVRSEKSLAKIAFIENRILFAVLKSN